MIFESFIISGHALAPPLRRSRSECTVFGSRGCRVRRFIINVPSQRGDYYSPLLFVLRVARTRLLYLLVMTAGGKARGPTFDLHKERAERRGLTTPPSVACVHNIIIINTAECRRRLPPHTHRSLIARIRRGILSYSHVSRTRRTLYIQGAARQ